MALLGNYSAILKSCGRFRSGSSISDNRAAFNTTNSNRNIFLNQLGQTVSRKNGVPTGYSPGYAWVPPQYPGGMAIYNAISGSGDVTSANAAGGLGAQSAITGSGDITTANLALVASAVATLSGIGSLSADIRGKLEAASSLAGSGNLTGAVGAIASVVAAITGSATTTAAPTATGSLSASITVTGGTLTSQDIAVAVWTYLSRTLTSGGGGGSLTQQDVRDAMLLAASAGTPAVGSVDAKLNSMATELATVDTNVTAVKSNTALIPALL